MVAKCQCKERARKAEQDYGKQPQRRGENPMGGEEEDRVAIKTEMPVNPSAEVPKAMTSSPIDLEEIGKSSKR